ncbi:translation initiation factor IF-2 [Ekhidna sp.]|uniref:translation initiation factor IF-2 n=1 Tax=Ekhidna sp. TaxID=2608089 RepID=UPI0032995954
MAEYRLSQVARKLNVGKNTILEFLKEKGHEVDSNPNSKIPQDQYDMLAREFADSAHDKEEASELTIGGKTDNLVINADKTPVQDKSEDERILIKDNVASDSQPEKISAKTKLDGPKVVGKIDLNKKKEEPAKEEPKKEEPKLEKKEEVKEAKKVEEKKKEEPSKEEPKKEEPKVEKKEEVKVAPKEEKPKEEEKAPVKEVIKAKADSLRGLKVLDKIELPKDKPKPVASSDSNQDRKKRPRKRIQSAGGPPPRGRVDNRGGRTQTGRKTEELSDKEIQDKIKATLAKLSGGSGKGGSQRSKYRKDKRSAKAEAEEERQLQAEEASKTLHVTEYISANDLASLMDVTANDVISACMSLGMFVSINQRLDAETITVIADEFGYEVDFTEAKEETDIVEEKDDEKELVDRAPIVTIMGHVDHGKTSLLDYIRDSKVTEGEAGGITQHIGAYDVMTESGKRVAFLDTPGHEAFTAMRARGAKITDVAIIVVAADDSVMPQTKEAINHAQVAGVPIVIAINKVDKPNANPEKIKEDLSNINILVEDWGGKYQCQHVSAKTGEGIDELLDKVLLEAELLELKANPDKPAVGSVVEASLDKGRGYVSTIMVQAGTLRVGDVLLAGPYFGKVKAMFDHRGHKLDTAGPSTPVLMLGLDGAPQAGDKFNVMESDREAREVANKREQILREQSIRTKKHITLDEIGRRLAIGSFKELNVIVKGDVDGSIEALADSLLKLSTEEVQVNILHKAVGQISESDVLLASASDAVIVGFQVRPSGGARRLAETEEIEIRLYSIIYDAINDVKDAMEGMLEPTSEEVITGNIEVRDVFKISKVGTVAGCYVTDGIVKRSNQVRLVRDGIVVYTGEINQLKRFKEDVSEVKNGYECGLSIKNFNDIKVGDIIEGFEVKEVKRTL